VCIVCTSRIAYPGGLDITVKSAGVSGQVLAPTWELVGGVKGWRGYEALTPERYAVRYYALIRSRYRRDERPFLALLEQERMVLTCYCAVHSFCHRHLV